MGTYGFTNQRQVSDKLDSVLESLRINGFVVVEDLLDEESIADLSAELDEIYDFQAGQYAAGFLESIREDGLVRAPLVQSQKFLDLAQLPAAMAVVRTVLGEFVQLHLQNGILNWANKGHHQRSWHRDLPYQNYAISRPLAISVLYALDVFDSQSGGTEVLPFSHREEIVPSDGFIEVNRREISASAGSAIIFDSMLVHRAGENISNNTRRAVNHVYTVPLIKQQIDLPRAMGGPEPEDRQLSELLGYAASVPTSEREMRETRAAKASITEQT